LHYTHSYKYLDVWHTKHKNLKRGPIVTQFFFINVDKLSQRERRTKKGRWDHVYADVIEQWDPDVIIFDESHRLKRAGGVGATTAWHMVHRLRSRRKGGNDTNLGGSDPPYVYLLTGTPSAKGYIDLFAQFRIMDSNLFGTAKSGFEELYCVYGKGRRQYTIIKYRRTKQILRRVHRHSTVVSSSEAGLAGEYVPNPIKIELPAKARQMYDRLCEDFIVELESGAVLDAKNAGVLRMRCLQITGGFLTGGEQIHDAKLTAFRDFSSDLLQQGQSMVVGTRFLPEVRAIRDAAERMGFRTHAVYGDIERADRAKAISTFQRHARREPHLLVFQSETGSLAIELAEAAEVLFYSLPDSWVTFWQFISRLGGPNQEHWPVRYTSLLCEGTADVNVLQALRTKRDMHKAMMKSPEDFLRGL
jgi:SNF2 family DNA or RNA helicase